MYKYVSDRIYIIYKISNSLYYKEIEMERFRRIREKLHKYAGDIAFLCFVLVLVVCFMTSCQGLANANGDGNVINVGSDSNTSEVCIEKNNW